MNRYIHSGEHMEEPDGPEKDERTNAAGPDSEDKDRTDRPVDLSESFRGESGMETKKAEEFSKEAEEVRKDADACPDGGSGSPASHVGEWADRMEAEPDSSSPEKGGKKKAAGEMEAAEEPGTGGEEGGEPRRKGFVALMDKWFGEEEEDQEDEEGLSPSGAKKPGEDKQQPDEEKEEGQEGSRKAKAKRKPKNTSQAAAGETKSDDPRQQKRDAEKSDSLEESIRYWQGSDRIDSSLDRVKETLKETVGLGSTFDVIFREMSFGGKRTALLCISGFTKDTIADEILKRLTYLTPENLSAEVIRDFMHVYIPHIQVELSDMLSETVNKVLTGNSALFIEGESRVIVMDTRAYPARSPDEPTIERVVRGSRDGFTETLLSNVALVRRRVRDPGLKLEMHQVGRRTRTDVCLAYIDDIVDKTQVQAVTDKIKSINIEGIPLADKQLEEAIIGAGWNPYPMVRYSERPDIVASMLLEGRIILFVDTSPSVVVLPTTFFDLCQHAEENRQTPFIGTYLRWVRFAGVFASMFLLPLWLLLVVHPELKPPMFDFLGPQKSAKLPLIAQFLLVEFGVDLLRLAAVHTPNPLGSAMGLIAAILVGNIAVDTGLFVNEVILYMAVAAIGMFATPSYELGLANRIVRLVLLVLVAMFQVPGLVIGSTVLIVMLTLNRSYNSSYLWPFIPFNAKALGSILFRTPVLYAKTRPSFNKARDNTRMSDSTDNRGQS